MRSPVVRFSYWLAFVRPGGLFDHRWTSNLEKQTLTKPKTGVAAFKE
jgi:hypothetical protein